MNHSITLQKTIPRTLFLRSYSDLMNGGDLLTILLTDDHALLRTVPLEWFRLLWRSCPNTVEDFDRLWKDPRLSKHQRDLAGMVLLSFHGRLLKFLRDDSNPAFVRKLRKWLDRNAGYLDTVPVYCEEDAIPVTSR